MTTKKVERRIKIKFRIRKNVNGTAASTSKRISF